MTDHQAEQDMELEALQAILMDEFTGLVGPRPADWPQECVCYRIAIKTDDGTEVAEGEYEKKMDIIFAHTTSYPDEPPLVKGMTLDDTAEVNAIVEEQIQANLGMAMIYAIVSALQDWLVDKAAGVKETAFQIDPKELERRQQELEEKRLAEIRAHGTPVTIDTFVAWKASYDTERQLQRAQADPESINRDKGPSGKAFFLAQEASGQQVVDEAERVEEYENDAEEGNEEDESEDFDDSDEDDEDEEVLLEQILAARQGQK